MNRQVFFRRIRAGEREYGIASLAVARLQAAVALEQAALRNEGLSVADLAACREHLEATYLIRLFAEFETPLRLYWRDVRGRPTWNTVKAETLIDRVAAYQHVPADVLTAAHRVREFRNARVHAPVVEAPEPITYGQCRSALCQFLSFLPLHW